ncbi:MAG: acyl carrier protein [Maribacter sp.]
MKETILRYIQTEISNDPSEDIESDEDLFGGGIIDSIGMIKLISFLQEEFSIEVPAEDMTVENFMTVESMIEYISKKTA